MADLNRLLAEKMGWRVEPFVSGQLEGWRMVSPPGSSTDGYPKHKYSEEDVWRCACPDYTTDPAAMVELLEWAREEQGMTVDICSNRRDRSKWDVAVMYGPGLMREATGAIKSAVAEAVARALGWEG